MLKTKNKAQHFVAKYATNKIRLLKYMPLNSIDSGSRF